MVVILLIKNVDLLKKLIIAFFVSFGLLVINAIAPIPERLSGYLMFFTVPFFVIITILLVLKSLKIQREQKKEIADKITSEYWAKMKFSLPNYEYHSIELSSGEKIGFSINFGCAKLLSGTKQVGEVVEEGSKLTIKINDTEVVANKNQDGEYVLSASQEYLVKKDGEILLSGEHFGDYFKSGGFAVVNFSKNILFQERFSLAMLVFFVLFKDVQPTDWLRAGIWTNYMNMKIRK
jgi:hypothetical protein